jgi:cyclic di-GMP phosphodiesterase Gmr
MTDHKSVDLPPSSLAERLEDAIQRWSRVLPGPLQSQFRREFEEFSREHDRTMSTIENIWKRRERRYAFDESTGLARRKPFQDNLAAVLMTPPSPLLRAVGVLFIDVDNLKRINDSFGHSAGDRAVAAVGGIIREAIRVDVNTDFMTRTHAGTSEYSVSRHGGDEFLVALELKEPSGIEVVAKRIKSHVDDPARQRAHGYTAETPVSISVGAVVYELGRDCLPLPAHALAQSLITIADEQMYEAKRDRRIHIVGARCTDRLEVDRENVKRVP